MGNCLCQPRPLRPTYRDFAKTHANPDTDGNALNRRVVMRNTMIF
jgi:hypothetical protein